jgi:upstream activation factor subunit UAF30
MASTTTKRAGEREARGGLAQQVTPDEVLAAVIGPEKKTRAEVTKAIWAYVKENELQDESDRRRINSDDKLRPVFDGAAQVSMFEMTRLVSQHLR